MKNRILYIIVLIAGFYSPLNANVVVNDDNTVSFSYCGAAKRVYLQSDLYYTDEDSLKYTDYTRRIKMHLESDGCWHVTTKPVQAEMYTYCFRVDGKRKPDLNNQDTAWQKKHKWNIVNICDTTQHNYYRTPIHQGHLTRTSWYSSVEKIERKVNIYTPFAYDTCINDLPVLFLIHGLNGYEGSWAERGRATHILENLIEEGLCEPMILVIPDVNICVYKDKPSHYTLWKNIINYPRLLHDHKIEKALVELIQMVDTNYRVNNKHYIAGLSDGARLAANTANNLPNYFKAVGLLSPVVYKDQLPKDSAVYYVYSGKKDMFHCNAKKFYKRLSKKSTAHHYIETIGGHTWRNWRLYLVDFIKNTNSFRASAE